MAISKTAAVFRKEGKTLDITPVAKINCGDIKVVNGLNCLASGTSRRARPAR